jgi:hypothetical protein
VSEAKRVKGAPFFFDLDDALIDKNLRTPKLTRIENGEKKLNWDERKGYGYTGAFSVFHGASLITFDLVFQLYADEDWALYAAVKPVLSNAPAGKRPKAIDIAHPILAELGVNAFVVTNEHQLTQIDPSGVWEKRFNCMQFREPKLALAKPEAAGPQKEEDPYDKIIHALSDKLQIAAAAQ